MWRNLYYLYLIFAFNNDELFSLESTMLLCFETLLTYYYDYYAFIDKEDKRYKEYQNNKVLIVVTSVIGGCTILYVTHKYNMLLITAFIWITFILPYRKIKKIPFMKSLIIGTLWTLNSIIFNQMITREISFVQALDLKWSESVTCFTFMNIVSIFNDLKDFEEDTSNLTNTIPVLFGVSCTSRMLICAKLALITYSVQYHFGTIICIYTMVLSAHLFLQDYSTKYYKRTVLVIFSVNCFSHFWV